MSTEVFIAIISAAGGLLASFVLYLGTRGKTNADRQSQREQNFNTRIDREIERQDKLRGELETKLAQVKEQREEDERQISLLRDQVRGYEHTIRTADRMGILMAGYMQTLRDHILDQLPPPPPTAPVELLNWLAKVDVTKSPPQG